MRERGKHVETAFPSGGGEVGALMRSLDWSRTDVGPPSCWPVSLRTTVAMILEMPTPAIIFWGPAQTQLYNDGYATIMGPRHPRYFGSTFEECWPETYPLFHERMKEILDGGEPLLVHNELIPLTRHGFTEEAYFTFTFSPIPDDEGRRSGIFQPVIETTESMLAERRAQVLRRLGSLLDSSGRDLVDGVEVLSGSAYDIPFAATWVWSEDGRRLVAAAQAGLDGERSTLKEGGALTELARDVCRTREQRTIEDVGAVLGRPQRGVWPEPTRRAFLLPLVRSPSDEVRGVVALGVSPRLHFDEPYKTFFQGIARQLATNLAAAQAKSVEKELLRREQQAHREAELQKENLQALVEQAPTPMVVLRGRELVVEIANPPTRGLWMRSAEEILDRPLLEALPELRDQPFVDLATMVYDTGEAYIGREARASLRTPEGELTDVFLNFIYAPLRNAQGDVDGVFVLAVDVTEQVRAREQVEGLKTAAEAANRAKDHFFAVLGHELRNPLAPILTALELMRLRGGDQVQREREVIQRQADHLVRLVDDLLDISRITRGKVSLKKERVRLPDVVSRAVEMALPLLEKRRHDLEIDLSPEVEEVEVDVSRLSQAIANLLTNAAKYTEPGGRVTVTSRREPEGVAISVRDTGIGLDPEFLQHVFDAFVQEGQALDRAQGGLGLGLAIVRGIAEIHGGRVEARSEGQGQGSEFILHLPLGEAPGVREPGRAGPPRPR